MTTATLLQQHQGFFSALAEQRLLKVIAGITNFDLDRVLTIARAAAEAGADAVDVAAHPDLIRAVKAETSLTVFASAVDADSLALAVEAGADVAELGNFDALYAQGVFLDEQQVLTLAQQTMARLAGRAPLCVTIPGHLSADAQRHLVQALAELGVDLIQTEGAVRALEATPATQPLSAAEKAAVTVANTRRLTAATRLPVMTASGMDADTVADAMAAGAAAIGLGAAVNQLASQPEMVAVIQAVRAQMVAAQQVASAA